MAGATNRRAVSDVATALGTDLMLGARLGAGLGVRLGAGPDGVCGAVLAVVLVVASTVALVVLVADGVELETTPGELEAVVERTGVVVAEEFAVPSVPPFGETAARITNAPGMT